MKKTAEEVRENMKIKCRDCTYYKEIDVEWGSCYGVKIRGARDPVKGSDKCRGKYFKPKKAFAR